MTETIQVEKDKVVAAFESGTDADKATLTKLFPDLLRGDLLKCIFTFEDVCKEAGLDAKAYEPMAGMTEDELHELYSRKIKLIYKVFNASQRPDFSNKKQAKYYPWFEYMEGSGFVVPRQLLLRLHVCWRPPLLALGQNRVSHLRTLSKGIQRLPAFLNN